MRFSVFCALKKLVRDRVEGGVVDIVKNFEKHCAPSAPKLVECLTAKNAKIFAKFAKRFFSIFPLCTFSARTGAAASFWAIRTSTERLPKRYSGTRDGSNEIGRSDDWFRRRALIKAVIYLFLAKLQR